MVIIWNEEPFSRFTQYETPLTRAVRKGGVYEFHDPNYLGHDKQCLLLAELYLKSRTL
jgi:hypothetical protein